MNSKIAKLKEKLLKIYTIDTVSKKQLKDMKNYKIC